MNGKQLKNSILQWAIQGKLVPQDPNDEPASVLLEKIRAEKARLVKGGKIKKDKKESIIYRGEDNSYYEKFADGKVVCIDDEIPFEIPVSWTWGRLSNMVQINPKNYVDDNKEAAFIPMEKIEATYLSSYTYTVRKWREIKSGYTHFADGDVAFAKITPCFQNRKSMILKSLPNGIGAGTSELKVLRTYSDTISKEYLLFFLESPYFVEEAIFKGTANQQRIISGYLENKLFPLPPLNEQRSIAEKIKNSLVNVERYAKLQDKLEYLNNNLNTFLKKSILQEAIQGKLVPQDPNDEPASVLLQRIKEEKLRLVKEGKLKKKDVVDSIIYKGDDNKYYEQIGNKITCIEEEIPFKIPKKWCWVRLSDIVLINPKNHVPDNTMAAFIPMERIDPTFLSSYSYVERKWGEIKQGFTHFSDGDVAFAKITPCFQNRKSMILNHLPNGIGAGTTELKVLRPYRNTLSVEYLLFFLESPYFVEEAIFKGTANQQRIMSGYMESKLFPLPSLEEQKRISKKIKEVYKQMIL